LALALAGAVVVAAALRFPFLGNQSLWYDETFTREIATASSLGDVWHGVKSTEATPPLYYVVTWIFGKAFGVHSDAGLRMVGAVASVASVPVAFAAVRRFVGRGPALATALLIATSPLVIAFALDARAYSLLLLLSLASIWAMSRVLEDPSRGRWLAWVAAATACLWTHYFGGFLVLAEVCVLLWKSPRRTVVLAWSAAVAALCVPLLSLLAVQADSRTDHIGSVPLGSRFEEAARQFAAGPNVPRGLLEAAAIALGFGGLAVGLAAIRRRDHPARPLAVLGALALALPAALSLTGIADRFLVRNELIAWGCFAAVAAIGLIRARAIPLAAYVAVSIAVVLWIQGDWHYRYPDWEGAARAFRSHAAAVGGSGVPVVVYPGYNSRVAALYFHSKRLGATPPVRVLWVLLEPARRGRREIERRPGLARAPSGFSTARTVEYRGFTLVELRAPRPTVVTASGLGPDRLGDVPALGLVTVGAR
jgi:mannosyltransferase